MRTLRENYREAAVTNILIHVGINYLPRDHLSDITTTTLLVNATKDFPNTSIYFSAIPPKFNNTFLK